MRNNLSLVDFWKPTVGFAPWFEEIDKILEPFSVSGDGFKPLCDLEETGTHYLLSFDLPGISKDDIKVEAVENQLTVSGQRKAPVGDEKNQRHFAERSYGEFKRTFTLPTPIESNHVEAAFRDGVLQIAVPKSESAKPRQIKISEGKNLLAK